MVSDRAGAVHGILLTFSDRKQDHECHNAQRQADDRVQSGHDAGME